MKLMFNNQQINAVAIGGGMHNYSTEEQVVGTWIDGSEIYQKTIYAETLPNNTSINITTPSNLDLLIDAEGFMKSKVQAGSMRTMPFAGGGQNDVRIDLQNGILRIMTFSDWTTYEAYITIRYTKTQEANT